MKFLILEAGDTITVFYKIREGNKERIQFFKGVVLQRRGSGQLKHLQLEKCHLVLV